MTELRRAGDAVVAQFFGNAKDRPRRAAIARLHEAGTSTDRLWSAIELAAASLRTVPHALRPFHWELEFPEVFEGDAPGFDAIVGNPPFAGKNTLINGNREHYLPWLQLVHPGAHGNADLVAHFVRRAFGLLRPKGCFGLIATNTVGQGDTRESGLRAVLSVGGSVLRAVRRLPWPGEAAVVVSVVHVLRGVVPSPVLDGRQVRRISAYLVEGDLDASPARLVENEGKAFQGFNLLGVGFTFDDQAVASGKPASTVSEMDRLKIKEPRNSERVFPFLGAEEVNTNLRHAHRRWCIDFNDFPLKREAGLPTWTSMMDRERAQCRRNGLVPSDYPDPVAADWPDLLEIVERLVKPERAKSKRDARKRRWWRFAENAPGLRAALETSTRPTLLVTGCAMTTFHVFARLPKHVKCSHKLICICEERPSDLGQLQSRCHELWSVSFGATAGSGDAPTYNPTQVFDNFPFLSEPNSQVDEATIGYENLRRENMELRQEGLTALYGRFHCPDENAADIEQFRQVHHFMDQAVLRAYGWHDLADTAVPEFLIEENEHDHRYQGRLFWPAPFRDEVLARLLDLNARRAADERARGLTPAPATAEEMEDA